MTTQRLEELVATMWAAMPGGFGMMGVMSGLQQGRIGPVIVGLVMIGLAMLTYRIFLKAFQGAKSK